MKKLGLVLNKYKLGFDVFGLLLFFIIMIPNCIWFAIPAPDDVLRADSVTVPFDTVASICQVIMIILLCVFINKERKKLSNTPCIITVIIWCILYFISWILYYNGITSAIIILGLTISPCLAFLFFAIDRKNNVALIPIFIFTICHLIYAIVNYII